MPVENPNEVTTSFRGQWLRERYGTDDRAPMTLSQASYLMTLCEETGEVLDDSMTRAEAAELIKELELATGRSPHRGIGLAPL